MHSIDLPIRDIRRAGSVDAEINLPPSKSYTNRALLTAALATGGSIIRNYSESDDSLRMIKGLQQFGIAVEISADGCRISGSGGILKTPASEIDCGNAGTTFRFLTTLACLAPGHTTLTGDEQMRRRPIGDLLVALQSLGIETESANGFPPISVTGGNFEGGRMQLNPSVSSQFVSSVLLSAPYAKRDVGLVLASAPRSSPYIDITLEVMRVFGAKIQRENPQEFLVSAAHRYAGRTFSVEPDASSATYFAAAAAISGGTISFRHLPIYSLQGDIHFFDILEQMGCTVSREVTGIEVQGAALHGIDADMNAMPDCVPALGIVAAFAKGETVIRNIGHLRYKESDRLHAIAAELTKLGTGVELGEDFLRIQPRAMHGALIETYHDHRIAMSFAVAGLFIDNIRILNPGCVSKSFPNFWNEFSKLESEG